MGWLQVPQRARSPSLNSCGPAAAVPQEMSSTLFRQFFPDSKEVRMILFGNLRNIGDIVRLMRSVWGFCYQ